MIRNFPVKLTLRIDWSEMDYFGHVNNVSFFKYIQAARVHYWEQIGIAQSHRATNIGPMLASSKCDFLKPLFYPGKVTVQSGISFIKNTSFGLSHQLLNEDHEITAIAEDVMVMFDFNENTKSLFPQEFRMKIEQLENKKFSL